MWDLLGETDPDRVPTGVLARLPDWGPFIEFPEPDGRWEAFGTLAGVVASVIELTDRRETHRLLTLVPVSATAHVFLPSVILLLSGVDTFGTSMDAFRRLHRSAFDESVDVREVIDATGREEEWFAAQMTSLARTVIPRLVYLCSQNAEIRRRQTPGRGFRPTKGRADRTVPEEAAEYDVGHTLGAKLRRLPATGSAVRYVEETGAARPRRPHCRSAHFQSYKVGPRDRPELQEVRVWWKAPVIVNEHLLDDHDRLRPKVREVSGDDARGG